ncbi:uncharacterized protein LOC124172471 [Ischnura elegans]|uniref:uncharacterized protein LOC124172471 n=1 Tax=Ischnura elegans TaxID=197161 RepID=UPI001ED8A32C|nr:uncharacterized protein LOC124172471 [Ischnura elegans]
MRENLPKLPPPPADAMCRKTLRTSTPMPLEDDMQSHSTLPMEEKSKVYDLSYSDEDFKKHVTRQLSMLRSMVALNRELLESVLKQLTDIKAQQNGGCSEVTDSSPSMENFLNISTEDELRAVEEELKNEFFADKMVDYLGKIGGNSVSDATRRTMRRIFDDNMASGFSLSGAGTKRSFMGLRLGRIVIRAVQESKAAPEKDLASSQLD